MKGTKALILQKTKALSLVKVAPLVGISIIAPLLGLNQALAGSIVNSALFIAVALFGPQTAVLVALMPSLIAASTGLLPLALAPMIPFIIIGNILLISVFSLLKKKNYWVRVFSAGFLKFVFLFSASSIMFDLLLGEKIASKVAVMMSWPQLFTAISGGLIAYLFLKSIKKL